MSFDDDDWGRPVQTSEFARVDALAGHLLIVFPIGYIEHSPTRFSQPGKASDVIVCDIIDLDAADDAGNPGKIYRTTWLRPSKLIVDLRPFINKKTIVRIGKGVAQNGMNAPWVANDAFGEPGAVDRARSWAQANPNFAVSTFTPPAQFPQQGGFQQPQFTPTPGSGYQGPARQQADFPQQPNQWVQQGQPQSYSQPPMNQYPQQPQQQPQPTFNGAPPQPAYNQQPNYGPPPQQPQQQPPQPPQQQYQQSPQQSYPVQGAPAGDAVMLDQMRAARARREEDIWSDKPPF